MSNGEFRIVGTDRSITFREVARLVASDEPLNAVETFNPTSSTFPNGCHICEVEVDPETGATEILFSTMVHDAGRIINPMLVAGQLHGGVVQGIGQALMEHAIWEPDSGQMISGSFMDYAMPRADTVPTYHVTLHEVPTASNPLGSKASAKPAPPPPRPPSSTPSSTRSAPYGILNVPMPATAARGLAGDPGGEGEARLIPPPSSPRRRGPIRRALSMEHDGRKLSNACGYGSPPARGRQMREPGLTRPARNPCDCLTVRKSRKSRKRRC